MGLGVIRYGLAGNDIMKGGGQFGGGGGCKIMWGFRFLFIGLFLHFSPFFYYDLLTCLILLYSPARFITLLSTLLFCLFSFSFCN